MTDQIQRGQQWLEELLELMKVPSKVQVSEEDSQDDRESQAVWLTIAEEDLQPEQINILIGEKGRTIDAMQYLANSLLNIGVEEEQQRAFTIELDGYRLRRQAELFSMAESIAQEVRETGQEREIKSLSSAERRQIHHFLKKAGDLVTESRGQEPDRRLVVRLGS